MADVRPKMLQGRERPAFKHKQHTQKAFEVLNQLRRYVYEILFVRFKGTFL